MLKRDIARSSDVLPSAMSSATAQGFLPQYTSYGTLAASLSPVAASRGLSISRSPSKTLDSDVTFIMPTTEKYGENRRPLASDVGPASLEEEFRNIVTLGAKNRSALPGQWKAA